MDFAVLGGGGTFGHDKPYRDGGISTMGASTGSVAAGLAVSCGLEHPVHPDGCRRCPDLAESIVRTAEHGDPTVFGSVGCEFPLESDFLSAPTLPFGIFVVAAAVGLGGLDDICLSEG